ncbi:alpha/beta hydrolase, partial [Mycolicibacterium farcinogenes]|nr:alpha/beta hydrolase [Mycolicibacterium farcinogenes]
AVTRPADAPPPARAATLVDQVATQARTALADIADRASNRSTVGASSVAIPAAAVSAPVPMARSVPFVNIVGSLVFNVVGAALQVFSGPPVLPPGSTVTVRTSTLEMPGSDQTVRADWYFPEDPDSATGVIYLQHGFMATGPMYSYTAAHLAEETNSIVVVPSLSSNLFDPDGEWIGGEPMQQSVADLFAGDRAELTASASAAAGQPVALPSKFVLVGHSLGGMLVVGAAGRMVDNGAVDDLAGVVLLDAVDTHGDMPAALDALSGANHRPVLLISSERYVWNRDGLVGDELQAARPGQFNGVMLVGGRHIDGLQGANPILQFAEYAIAGFSQPQNIAAVRAISAGWINDMYAGGEDGVYGAPGQSIDIPTPSGTAGAVVLPFPSTEPVTATPWDGLVGPILDGLFRYAVYEPLAGRSVAVAV